MSGFQIMLMILISAHALDLNLFPFEKTEKCQFCGHNCDSECNCGICSGPDKCASEGLCMGACNGGGNAKWCGGSTPDDTCHYCGHNCDDECNCGTCAGPDKCATETLCMGACNSGGNAKWCGDKPPAPPAPPTVLWSTKNNKLQANGTNVVLHGFGTTCTEYLLRGIGMKCFISYNWPKPSDLLHVNNDQLDPLIAILRNATAPGVMPAVRIPLTASSWLGVSTTASSANMQKYPDLGQQYQRFIQALVVKYTGAGIVTILDLHWSDDDTDNAPMAKKGNVNCVDFWSSVASTFKDNSMVFFELYNEPHVQDNAQWMNGDEETSGMLEMFDAVRQHSSNPVIIAGARQYAYDSDSLIQLDGQLRAQNAVNVIWNFHPYMGPPQAGSPGKCPAGFEAMLQAVSSQTERPSIITEFGQHCCETNAQCESCPASNVGYDEDIIKIAAKYDVSWLPWAWRPMASAPNTRSCMDVNGGQDPAGLSLVHPTDGLGADFLTLWQTYG